MHSNRLISTIQQNLQMSPGDYTAPAAQNTHGLQETYVGRQINGNGPRQTWLL